jgi:OmcA/MtrC family decaheme c-type cytochrome
LNVLGTGTYAYTFGTKLPAGFAAAATHTLGVWATRAFGGRTYVANTLYDFVPNGGAPSATRDIVTTQACNQCHDPLGYHEGDAARRDVKLCALCHAGAVTDVTNGASLAMPAMVHQIHRGRFLPSVADGGTYALTEDIAVDTGPSAPALVDHSDAWFPGDVQNCAMCHKGAQGDAWKTAPSRSACGGCHDRTSFTYPAPAGMTLHPGGQQKDDATCLNAGCHGPADRYAVAAVHLTPATDPTAPKLTLAITSVTGTQPGQTPVVHFTATVNGQPRDLVASPLPWLAVAIAGPTTDYAQDEPILYPIETGAPQAGLASDGAAGSYAFTFPAPIPVDAHGSYAVAMEGYVQRAGAGGPVYAALNPVMYVAVTDPAPVPRRDVVDRRKCNACHYDLVAHEGTRKSPEYCVLCHTPNKVADQNAPRFEVPATTVPSVSFKMLVHGLHMGSRLASGYVVGADPGPSPASPGGTPIDFGKVVYPGDLRACWACHASTTYLPPLVGSLLPTVSQEVLACADTTSDPNAYCASRTVASRSTLGPLTAACTACHDAPASLAHAQSHTAADGTESCTTCHGAGAPQDAQAVHALPP